MSTIDPQDRRRKNTTERKNTRPRKSQILPGQGFEMPPPLENRDSGKGRTKTQVAKDRREQDLISSQESKKALQQKKKFAIAEYKKRGKLNDTAAWVLSMVGLLTAFVEVEFNYEDREDKPRNTSDEYGHAARAFVSILTVFLLILIVRYYYLEYKIHRERQTTSQGVGRTFFRSHYFRWMLIECLYNAIHAPPGIDTEMDLDVEDGTLILSLDGLLATIMLLRVYIIIRMIKHYTKWSNMYAERKCERFGTKNNTIFVLKAIFKESPYVTLSILMVLSIAIFGMATRTFERPHVPEYGSNLDYDYIWNAMWLVVLTMTTVGYGDFYPQSHMGRFIIVIACFWGVFLVSMMVVTLTDSSEFTKGERRAYEILSRLKAKEESKKIAGTVVKNSLQLWVLKQKSVDLPRSQRKAICSAKRNDMHHYLQEFKLKRKEWIKFDVSVEEMLRQLTEKLEVDLEELKSQIASVVEIDNQLEKVEEFQEISSSATNVAIVHLEELQKQFESMKEEKDMNLGDKFH